MPSSAPACVARSGSAQPEQENTGREGDRDPGIEQEGGLDSAQAPDGAGQQRAHGGPAHGGSLQAAGGAHQGISPASCGMAAVMPGCSTLSATPKHRTSRTVAVSECTKAKPARDAATISEAAANSRPIGRRSSNSPETGASRTTGRPPAMSTMVTASVEWVS